MLTSPQTFSSGALLAAALVKAGARVVGVPAGQGGNHFGEVLPFTLPNSRLRGSVSSTLMLEYPDDPAGHRDVGVEVELTYERWVATGFDPNAEVLLALEHFAPGASALQAGQDGLAVGAADGKGARAEVDRLAGE